MSKRRSPTTPSDRRRSTSRARFVVQAPAGSGKTELLIQRYLVLLVARQAAEAIVATAFTRKAAGEIRERIVAALRSAEADAAPAGTHCRGADLAAGARRRIAAATRALEWNLIAHPARLQVQTIDALCASLIAPRAADLESRDLAALRRSRHAALSRCGALGLGLGRCATMLRGGGCSIISTTMPIG